MGESVRTGASDALWRGRPVNLLHPAYVSSGSSTLLHTTHNTADTGRSGWMDGYLDGTSRPARQQHRSAVPCTQHTKHNTAALSPSNSFPLPLSLCVSLSVSVCV